MQQVPLSWTDRTIFTLLLQSCDHSKKHAHVTFLPMIQEKINEKLSAIDDKLCMIVGGRDF